MTVDIERLRSLAKKARDAAVVAHDMDRSPAERYRLRVDWQVALKDMQAAASPDAILALLAERDALAADARRYRWLATRVQAMSPRMDGTFEPSLHLPSSMRAESFDAAVDAAIAAPAARKTK